jgi:hypothetical protein|tara:strand:+ start:507 stop:1052 length:546 start_codon:yes stop_codon:yes gene_type:complete
MSSIFKVGSKTIKLGRSWVSDKGIQHPSNWGVWSAEERKTAGIEEIVLQSLPDKRLYTSSHNADGSVNSTALDLDDTSESGVVVKIGVKSSLKNQVKSTQASLLAQTDWAIIRKADKGTAIPSNIQTWRDAIRTKATEMETEIDKAANTDAIEALFFKSSLDSDGKVVTSGILYNWPELEE